MLKSQMNIDDHLRRLNNAQAALVRARLQGKRLEREDEILIADSPSAANEYSKEFFGAGRLPDHMHEKLDRIFVLKNMMSRTKWSGDEAQAYEDYLARVGDP